jgi:hypothetical protein
MRAVPKSLLALVAALALGVVTLHATTLRTYSFDNGSTLQAGFTQQITASPVIEFGGVGYSGTGEAAAFDANHTYANDQYSEITLDSTINQVRIHVRAKQQDAARDAYFAEVFSDRFLLIYKCIDGTNSQVGSTVDAGAGFFVADAVIRVQISSDSLTVKKNGTDITGAIGISMGGQLTAGSAGFGMVGGNIRAWEGGDDSAPPATRSSRLLLGVGP